MQAQQTLMHVQGNLFCVLNYTLVSLEAYTHTHTKAYKHTRNIRWIKILATKSKNLNSTLKTHMVEEKISTALSCRLTFTCILSHIPHSHVHVGACTQPHTHV